MEIGVEFKKSKRITLELYSDDNAKALAQDIFEKFQINDQITFEAFLDIFDDDKQAKEAFELFDRDGNGHISLQRSSRSL